MQRTLGFWRCWAMVVGGMIGSGVFMLPAVLAPYGSLSLLGWVFAGGGTIFVALVLGSLASRLPRIGGPYAYTREAFGDLPGFLIAWGYWISLWASTAALSVAFVGYLAALIPTVGDAPGIGAVTALALIWAVTGINLSGVKTAGVVQLVSTLLKLLPLLFVAVGGLILGDVVSVPATNPDSQPFPLLIAGMIMLTMWAFLGVEYATVPAEDVVEPRKTIPTALVAGAVTVTIVYILATSGVMALIPIDALAVSTSPFADAADRLVGGWGTRLVALGALISIVGAMNVNVLVSGMMPRAVALDGLFPAVFGSVNRRGAPAFALVVSGSLASILIALNFTRGLVAAFELLILLATLNTLLPYAASSLADLALLRRDRAAGARVRWKPVGIAVGALGFAIFTIVGSGAKVAIYGTILLAASVPVYLVLARRRSSAMK